VDSRPPKSEAASGQARTDAPKTNREPAEVERKLSLLSQPHVAPLTEFIRRLREAMPDAAIPFIDPTEAGVKARILLLLEAPGRRSGLIVVVGGDEATCGASCARRASTEAGTW
jgi:hypothetical protein